MAEVDIQFLGEQIKRIQADLRGLRTEQLRLEADQSTIRAEMAAGFDHVNARIDALARAMDARFDQLEGAMDVRFAQVTTRSDSLARAMDARFEQTHQTMATNLAVVLEAIKGLKGAP